ncbi:hypothetical protein DFH08DRAFT_512989 [Mycena albidolilacea]|uniref:Uncharacterized protein n=1 Tax=Mycena albidolilacea TaxID=1033008 RepID=A0AAD6Z594_9AGAR|nr:hypothetical protein DFH08DRAFT_512989 [Mycena albidolilacea]
MRSFININTLAMAAVALTVLCMAPSKVNADIITYTGDECAETGTIDFDFPCDGICRSFADRRSFRIDAPGNHCVTIFEDTVCRNPVTAFGNPPAAEGICIEVSTGTPQQSFTCVTNTNCNN